jgi:hypothetical protein
MFQKVVKRKGAKTREKVKKAGEELKTTRDRGHLLTGKHGDLSQGTTDCADERGLKGNLDAKSV